MMTIKINAAVEADLLRGKRFYDKLEPGLGREFLISIRGDIRELAWTGGIHSQRFDHFRVVSSRFPFLIFYAIRRQQVVVRAVLDGRRDPAKIARRLSR